MSDKTTSNEASYGGRKTQSRQGQYAKFEPLVETAIQKLQALLSSRNEAIQVGAIKLVLERTIPAIKAVEITGENGEPIKFNILAPASYLSALGKSLTASTAGTSYGQGTIQSLDLAPQSKENNNSNQSVSSVEST